MSASDDVKQPKAFPKRKKGVLHGISRDADLPYDYLNTFKLPEKKKNKGANSPVRGFTYYLRISEPDYDELEDEREPDFNPKEFIAYTGKYIKMFKISKGWDWPGNYPPLLLYTGKKNGTYNYITVEGGTKPSPLSLSEEILEYFVSEGNNNVNYASAVTANIFIDLAEDWYMFRKDLDAVKEEKPEYQNYTYDQISTLPEAKHLKIPFQIIGPQK